MNGRARWRRIVDERPAARHVAAQRADRLRQRAHLDLDAAVHAEVVHRAAAVAPEHAARMGVIDHHDGARLLGDLAERFHRPEIPVHAEHAVGDEQFPLRRREPPQDLPRRADVAVREHLDRRPAQAAAVDDAGVVQLVRHDDVFAGQDRRDRAGVGCEPALEDHRRLGLLELGEPALELLVQVHRPRDRTDRAGADPVALDRLERALLQLRVCRQAEVVVGREVDDAPAVDVGPRGLRAVEDPDVEGGALVAQRLEFHAEVVQGIERHLCEYSVEPSSPVPRPSSLSPEPPFPEP